jgi:acyl-CoA thioesterase-1
MRRLFSVALLMLLMATIPAGASTINILALGDSLTAGFGLGPDDAFPSQLEAALKVRGHDVRIINAGVSGDTAGAARDRLDWVLTDDVSAVILELGANDALRGIDPEQTKAAISAILGKLAARKLPVLLAGMRAPRNLGPDFAARFDAIYPELARTFSVIYYPFFLDGVVADPHLNQADGMHPSGQGVAVIVARILPSVEALIARVDTK